MILEWIFPSNPIISERLCCDLNSFVRQSYGPVKIQMIHPRKKGVRSKPYVPDFYNYLDTSVVFRSYNAPSKEELSLP
jgi:hypothetical protein